MALQRALISSLLVGTLLCAPWGAGWAAPPDMGWLDGDLGQVLNVRGMTFVASEGSINEIVLRAERARFYPDRQVADLEQVDVEVASGEDRVGFEMRCDEGLLNLTTQSFVAEGNVVGTIEGGRRFEATWVAYDEKQGLLYTDEPVLIVDARGNRGLMLSTSRSKLSPTPESIKTSSPASIR